MDLAAGFQWKLSGSSLEEGSLEGLAYAGSKTYDSATAHIGMDLEERQIWCVPRPPPVQRENTGLC